MAFLSQDLTKIMEEMKSEEQEGETDDTWVIRLKNQLIRHLQSKQQLYRYLTRTRSPKNEARQNKTVTRKLVR